MWTQERFLPSRDDEHDLILPQNLGFEPEPGSATVDPLVQFLHESEFLVHYLRVTYRGVKLGVEAAFEGAPYAKVYHDEPCRSLEPLIYMGDMQVPCAQVGGLEHDDGLIHLASFNREREMPIFTRYWSEPEEGLRSFGRMLLGPALGDDEALAVGEEFGGWLRDLLFDRRGSYWEAWGPAEERYFKIFDEDD